MSIYSLRTASDCTQLSVKLTELFDVKLSRMKENLANALSYSSFNALVADVKKQPVAFDTYKLTCELMGILSERHGLQLDPDFEEKHTLGISEYLNRFHPCPEAFKSIYQIDFKLTSYNTDVWGQYLDDHSKTPGVHTLSDFLIEAGLTEKPIEFEGHYLSEYEIEEGISLSLFEKDSDSLVLFANKSGDVYNEGSRLVLGYGSLLLKSKAEIDDVTFDTSIRHSVLGKCREPSEIQILSIERHEVAFLDKSSAITGTPVDNYEEFQGDMFSPWLQDFTILAWSKALELIANDKGSFLSFFGSDGSLSNDENTCHLERFNVSINDEERCILIESPSFMELYECLGWDYAQDLFSVPIEIQRAFEGNPKYAGYSFQHSDECDFDIAPIMSDQILILHDLDVALLKSKGIDIEQYFTSHTMTKEVERNSAEVRSTIDTIQSLTTFIDILKSLNVYSISVNELVRHYDGDMVSNSFCAYDRTGTRVTVFEVRSVSGYCQNYRDIIEAFKSQLEGGLRVVSELEYSWRTVAALPDYKYENPPILELAECSVNMLVPYIKLVLQPTQADLLNLMSSNTPLDINKSDLLDLLFPALHFSKEKIAVCQPVILPYSSIDEHISQAISTHAIKEAIDSDSTVRLFDETLPPSISLFGNRDCVPCLIIFCDVTEAEIHELTLRHTRMLGFGIDPSRSFNENPTPGQFQLPQSHIQQIGSNIGLPGLEAIFYSDSVDRERLLGL
ncbi:hypothetical protein [Vibrio mediterranei]|uniref:hypothetical protein n=1 Tax=Vibrio mediterranei TaxID=689 RepID=UPI0040681787